jgi:DNA mismatch repair protein MutS
MTALEEKESGVKNYSIAVKKRGDSITFLRKIIPGGADRSYGIEVAALAGVPSEVTGRAKEILKMLDENAIDYIKCKNEDVINNVINSLKNKGIL